MLISSKNIKISNHGYGELTADHIRIRDILATVQSAIKIEDYPDYGKGASVLVLQFDSESKPIHVVWGIPKGHNEPAVVITAYRPDPEKWSSDFLRRKNEKN
jgi:hypothetical protein